MSVLFAFEKDVHMKLFELYKKNRPTILVHDKTRPFKLDPIIRVVGFELK